MTDITTDPFKVSFTYHWHHIPTNKSGIAVYTDEYPFSLKDMVEKIDNWNRLGKDVWVYTLEPIHI